MDTKLTAAERKTAIDNLRTNLALTIRQVVGRIYEDTAPAELQDHIELAVKQCQVTTLIVAQALMKKQDIKDPKSIPDEIELAATLDVYNDIVASGGLMFYQSGQVNVNLVKSVTTRGLLLTAAGFHVIAVFNQMYIPELIWRSSIAEIPIEGLKNINHALLITKGGNLVGYVKYVVEDYNEGKRIVPRVTLFKDVEEDSDAKTIATIMQS